MVENSEIAFGDDVRVRVTPATQAAGVAGRIGSVAGFTIPSHTRIDVIGELRDDFALSVLFENPSAQLWFAMELLEPVEQVRKTIPSAPSDMSTGFSLVIDKWYGIGIDERMSVIVDGFVEKGIVRVGQSLKLDAGGEFVPVRAEGLETSAGIVNQLAAGQRGAINLGRVGRAVHDRIAKGARLIGQ